MAIDEVPQEARVHLQSLKRLAIEEAECLESDIMAASRQGHNSFVATRPKLVCSDRVLEVFIGVPPRKFTQRHSVFWEPTL